LSSVRRSKCHITFSGFSVDCLRQAQRHKFHLVPGRAGVLPAAPSSTWCWDSSLVALGITFMLTGSWTAFFAMLALSLSWAC
jgi:NAD(P) transhydrogenase subunit beta